MFFKSPGEVSGTVVTRDKVHIVTRGGVGDGFES
jgi:hypothetical protein